MGWHYDAFCDWAPIQPHPVKKCKGGCGTWVDAKDGYCRNCRKGVAAKSAEQPKEAA